MKLFYLSILAFVFTASSAMALIPRQTILTTPKTYNFEINEMPVLNKESSFPIFSGQGVIAVDIDSGVSLYEKDADNKLYPASTTKILTALVAIDFYTLSDILVVGDIKTASDEQRMGLIKGEEISFDNLMSGLLIYSANDAAWVLADNYPGGSDAFIASMNEKARSLHLNNSHFTNPVGLDDVDQVATARDMVRLAEVAMRNMYFASIVGTKEKIVTSADGKIIHNLKSTNTLLGKVDGVAGIKTGWTNAARENLITSVTRNGHRVIIAVLGSQDRFGETKELIDWVYGNYKWQSVIALDIH